MTGTLCDQIADKCISNPCLHDADCITLPLAYRCDCPYPYEGIHCEIDTDVCIPNPCLHGGTCFYDNRVEQGYQCSCIDGFIGQILIMMYISTCN